MSTDKETTLLNVISSPSELDLLYDLWTLANKAPSQCATILLQYKDVVRSMKIAIQEMKEVRDELRKTQIAVPEVEAMLKTVKEWKLAMKDVDEDIVLNRINRLCEVAERIRLLRKSGELETLKSLLQVRKETN